jgi:hypothetical protein
MPDSSPALRDRLAAWRVLGRAGPVGRGAAGPRDGTPPFEIRRTVRSVAEIFGRDRPRAGDEDAVFLDTETTGLAGGAGTMPFLIGLACVEGRDVVIEQYFLRRLAGEPAMLDAVRARLDEAGVLVTFNGRRFDWPILEARAIIGRLPLPAPPHHHDLMSLARRLWYRPLGTYRLSVIERAALGIERGDDIDSAEIPGMYLEYLRSGDPGVVEPVFAHNRSDIVSLIHLRRRARGWIEDGEDPSPPVDWEGLGALRMAARDDAGAEAALRRALAVEDDPAVRWRAARRLARILRRSGRWDDLLDLWERAVGGRGVWRAQALIEASKVCQRRLGRPDRAVAALAEAGAVVEWLLVRGEPAAQALDLEVRARLARLSARALV